MLFQHSVDLRFTEISVPFRKQIKFLHLTIDTRDDDDKEDAALKIK